MYIPGMHAGRTITHDPYIENICWQKVMAKPIDLRGSKELSKCRGAKCENGKRHSLAKVYFFSWTLDRRRHGRDTKEQQA